MMLMMMMCRVQLVYRWMVMSRVHRLLLLVLCLTLGCFRPSRLQFIWSSPLKTEHKLSSSSSSPLEYDGSLPEHALSEELFQGIKQCGLDVLYCSDHLPRLLQLSNKVANDYANILLYDRAQQVFEDVLYFAQTDHLLGQYAAHIISVLSFAQGRHVQVSLCI